MDGKASIEVHVRRWWTAKYKLPPTHDAYLRARFPDLLLEYFEDAWEERSLLDALAERGPLNDAQSERHAWLRTLLDDKVVLYDDPLIDKWERELAEGKIPDLDEQWPLEGP